MKRWFIRNVLKYTQKNSINQSVTNNVVKITCLENSTGSGKPNKKMCSGKPGRAGGPGYRKS